MKMIALFALVVMSGSSAFAVAPCNKAGQNGCPSTFKAATNGCGFCQGCIAGGGSVTFNAGKLGCTAAGFGTVSVSEDGNGAIGGAVRKNLQSY